MFSFFKRKKTAPQPSPAKPELEPTVEVESEPLVQVEAEVEQPVEAEAKVEPAVDVVVEPVVETVVTEVEVEVFPLSESAPVEEAFDAHSLPAESSPVEEASDTSRRPSAQPESLQIDNSMFHEQHREATAVESIASSDASAEFEPSIVSPTLPEPTTAPVASEPEPAAPKRSWLSRLRAGLSRTGQAIGGVFVGVKVDEDLFEELETALIMADAGVEATEQLLTALRAHVRKERLTEASQVKDALRGLLTEHLRPLEKNFELQRGHPVITMIAGVNGAGKTTSIGKLAKTFQTQGASVLLAAGDTFRAAAREQLVEWGRRNNVTVIAQEGGDPAAVAFDAVNAGKARQTGVVMVDTAGRLPTQLHLMEELKKVKRVITKAEGSAPHEVLLVVDGNTGQNALSQIKAFDAAIGLTGLVVTKLDGTARGGILAAVAAGGQGVRPIPVYWIGVGESIDDLQPFVAAEFAGALLGDDIKA